MQRAPKHRRILGESIRRHRKVAGLSQERLAEKAGLSPVFISRVECGKETISVDAIKRIASALRIKLRKLFWEI